MLKFHLIELLVECIELICHFGQGSNGLRVVLDDGLTTSHWQFCIIYTYYQPLFD